MKNKNTICFFALTLLINFIGVSQATTFVPDDNFEQALIDLGYDTGPLDNFVPTANINTITDLNTGLASKNISDLTGIQDFTALSILNCSDNNLSNLNLSSNLNLTEIYCSNNLLTSLNVSVLTKLKILWCDFNQLTAIDVTNNADLISLTCGSNMLTNIDVTRNSKLNVLVCENNQIPIIDVSQNLTLDSLLARNNLLSTIDVSQNSDLTFLDCGINQLTNLDVTQNTNLRVLLCFNNQLTSLDVTQNTLLSDLSCEFNSLIQLDMSQNTSLVNLDCSDNNLCILNIKNGTNENATIMDFESNPNLSCVIIDDISISFPNWKPYPFSNFVEELSDCSNFVPVDTLEDFIGSSYALPTLNDGNYFTQSGGNGTALQAGDMINSSQTIFIYNETICDSNESNFTVTITSEDYFIPKYFTPNNDGKHDYWKVEDFSNAIKNIRIFNRYGKLLKSLPPGSEGWNGTFNGELLTSDDYWYLIALNSGASLKGHFTLKR